MSHVDALFSLAKPMDRSRGGESDCFRFSAICLLASIFNFILGFDLVF